MSNKSSRGRVSEKFALSGQEDLGLVDEAGVNLVRLYACITRSTS